MPMKRADPVHKAEDYVLTMRLLDTGCNNPNG
jgi:hypothetical protein